MLRKKEVDSVDRSRVRRQQLERKLSAFDLAAVGVGATVGAGVYILVGTVARDHAGPALPLSFLVAGLAAGLSAFCEEKMPSFLARHTILELGGVVIDPCAAIFVIIATVLMCLGIDKIATTINASALLFIFSSFTPFSFDCCRYFPFGMNGMFAGSAIVFFSYIGFDSVMNPQRDFRLGIGTTISVCCILYMLVFAVIVGLVPYHALDPDTPISSAFSSYGVQWPVYFITIGAVTALFASLLAMARDGLSWSCFSNINEHTHVPVKGTAVSGICAAILAFFMDVSQLSGMVSVGTLLAFTSVAVSVLIIRYVPSNGVPLPLMTVSPMACTGIRRQTIAWLDECHHHSSTKEDCKLSTLPATYCTIKKFCKPFQNISDEPCLLIFTQLLLIPTIITNCYLDFIFINTPK
ncbi:hypothetical protein UlMin_006981 [Ulmus minor]